MPSLWRYADPEGRTMTFDRDARELAKDAIAFYSRYANPLLLDALIDAARWAVEVTEGDGIWWCERHQCCWGYTPDCGWSPRGEACPKSRRLLIEWEAK